MTRSEIFKLAHSEAKRIMALKRLCFERTYAEAFAIGLRRAHNENISKRNITAILSEPKMPKFMWLTGF